MYAKFMLFFFAGHDLVYHLRGLTADGAKTGKFASMTTDLNRQPPHTAQMTMTSAGVPVVPYMVGLCNSVQPKL